MGRSIRCFDRDNLMMYASGTMLDFVMGVGVACDELAAEEAVRAMQNGETIHLTERGHVVGAMRLDAKKGYVESRNQCFSSR